MNLRLLWLVLASLPASAATRFVGGGPEVGPTAPIYAPFRGAAVTVSQLYYTQLELQLTAGARIIDVAWRKEGLGPLTGAGGCGVQVWMKNVSRQAGPFTEGSTQLLSDALLDAQKVIDRPGGALPSTMGFLTLASTENSFAFDYTGDSLEVTIVTDCRSAAAPATDAPLRWRYDVVPERVRVASGDTTDGLLLGAEPLLSSWRPHTRFRTLSAVPSIELRVAGNVLPNGATFGLAPKHLAAGLPAPFNFELFNEGQLPVEVTAVTFSGVQNGTASTPVTFPVTVPPGGSVALPVSFTPATTALARLSVSVVTSQLTHTNTFQGTPTAAPEAQPAASLVRPDGTAQPLSTATATVVSAGNVAPGHQVEVTVLEQNFGAAPTQAQAQVVSGEVEVPAGSNAVGGQQDVKTTLRTRVPLGQGSFSSEVAITVGPNVYRVRTEGTVVAPDIAVAQGLTDLPNEGTDTLVRPDDAPLGREYEVKNVGDAPLHVVRTGRYVLPRVLPPGLSSRVTLSMPRYDASLEPFVSQIDSDDPDEHVFTWYTVTGRAGRPVLAVSYRELGFKANSAATPLGVSRGERVVDLRATRVEVGLANNGDRPLHLTNLGETCVGCPSVTLPAELGPGELFFFARDFKEGSGRWSLSYEIQSDDPDGAFPFSLEGKASACSAAPGPLLVGLLALFFARRRRRGPPPLE